MYANICKCTFCIHVCVLTYAYTGAIFLRAPTQPHTVRKMMMRAIVAPVHTATCCNTLQHAATRCNTLQHTATHCRTLPHTATHYNTLHHTAIRFINTLQHTTHTHCNTLVPGAAQCNPLQHTATTHCNLQRKQHTATHCTRSSTSAQRACRTACPVPPLLFSPSSSRVRV